MIALSSRKHCGLLVVALGFRLFGTQLGTRCFGNRYPATYRAPLTVRPTNSQIASALGAIGIGATSQAINLSYSPPHEVITYIAWYGVGLTALAGALFVFFLERASRSDAPGTRSLRLKVAGCGVKRGIVLYGHDGQGPPFEVAYVLAANALHSADPSAVARDVRGLVEFLDASGKPIARSEGNWAENALVSTRQLGEPTDDLYEMDLLANGVPKTLEVALHFEGDDSVYPYSHENYGPFRAYGDLNLRVGPALPNPTTFRVAFTGSGVVTPWRHFSVRLDEQRLLQIEPVGDDEADA